MRNSIFDFPKYYEETPGKITPNQNREKHEHMRRALSEESAKIKNTTISWARSIPSSIRPRALIMKYPRVANILADSWARPAAFDIFLRELMLDNRGGRQGFSFDVLQDLANLRSYFDQTRPKAKHDIWHASGKPRD